MIAGLGGLAAGCASAPPPLTTAASVPSVGPSAMQNAGDVASQTAHAGWDTVGQAYNGVGGAMRSPFQDFGLMNKSIPPVLARARIDPYSTDGLTSCEAVLEEVSALDAVLGPDMDNPEIKGRRNRYSSGADMAADAALQAAKDTIEHFIPMRGTIRNLSGASRAQAKDQKSHLAGNIRRGFLKSVGMAHNCAWPAAPMSFQPQPGGPQWPPLILAKVDLRPAAPLAHVSAAFKPGAIPPAPPAAPGATVVSANWRIGRSTDTAGSTPN